MNKKPSVLIVDDDPEVLKSLQIWLKNEGFKVLTASTRDQAKEIVKQNNIAVCLADLRLKNDDGLRLGAELRTLDERLKVIIITGYPTYESAIDAMKNGVFDYISKSTDNDTILKKVRSAVAARESECARAAQENESRAAIVLVGHHLLVREGLENFFKECADYRLMQTYHAFDFIKKSDFNLDAVVLLICASCNEAFLADPEKMFSTLKHVFPNAKPIIINCTCPDERKLELLRHGVKGFLPANINKLQLKKAMDCILAGQIWISRELSHKLLSDLLEDTNPEIAYQRPVNTFELTNREIEILQALASGLSNFAISEKLFLSEKTVKTHTHHIFKKMEVKTRTQAVMKAMEHHII
jgi:DNA-binding NarL/FixJ family response regulator